ncbi:hypothetical protein TNCV_1149461 [Trichonephila clavipes]|nr:hypothetical protein TNCV_1149461 [Trichonephila clavipes]
MIICQYERLLNVDPQHEHLPFRTPVLYRSRQDDRLSRVTNVGIDSNRAPSDPNASTLSITPRRSAGGQLGSVTTRSNLKDRGQQLVSKATQNSAGMVKASAFWDAYGILLILRKEKPLATWRYWIN